MPRVRPGDHRRREGIDGLPRPGEREGGACERLCGVDLLGAELLSGMLIWVRVVAFRFSVHRLGVLWFDRGKRVPNLSSSCRPTARRVSVETSTWFRWLTQRDLSCSLTDVLPPRHPCIAASPLCPS